MSHILVGSLIKILHHMISNFNEVSKNLCKNNFRIIQFEKKYINIPDMYEFGVKKTILETMLR